MALNFCDGFDHYDTDLLNHKWDYSGGTIYPGTPSIAVGEGRFASNAVKMTDTWCRLSKAMPNGPLGTVTAGVAYRPYNGLVAANMYILTFLSGTTFLISVGVTATQNIFIQCGGYAGPIIAYGGTPVRTNAWNYIEMQVSNFSSGGGAVKVWLNEALILDLSGVMTTYGGYSVAEAVMLGGRSSWLRTDMPDQYFDDFYLTDANGSDNTANLGDVRIIEQLPISDHDKEWTPSAGIDHYALVDDPAAAIDDDATYVTTPTHDAKDTYAFPPLPTVTGDVKAMAMNFYAKKLDSGSRGVSMTATLNESPPAYGDGNERRVGGDYVFYQSFMERDPNGALWTIPNVNASRSGPKLTT